MDDNSLLNFQQQTKYPSFSTDREKNIDHNHRNGNFANILSKYSKPAFPEKDNDI